MSPTAVTAVLFASAYFFVFASAAGPAADIPDELDFGTVEADTTVERTLDLCVPSPAGGRAGGGVEIGFFSACPCVRVLPNRTVLHRSVRQMFTVTFDSAGYTGPVEKWVFVRSSDPGLDGRTLRVRADVAPGTEAGRCISCEERRDPAAAERALAERAALAEVRAAEAERATSDESPPLLVLVYSDAGCRKCQELLSREIPEMSRRVGRDVRVDAHDIMDPEAMRELVTRMEKMGVAMRAMPIAFVEGTPAGGPDGEEPAVLQGIEEIRAGLERVLAEGRVPAAGSGGSGASTAAPPDSGGRGRNPGAAGGYEGTALTALSVGAAGLVDGINPCAFSTILFLVSMLAVVGRTRRQILLTGIVYTAVIYLGYFAVGLGLLASVRRLLVFPVIASVIRWALVAVLVVLAALSLRDALVLHRGDSGSVLLQLPEGLKKRIKGVVRGRVRMGSVLAGTALMAVLVTVFEFSCTGQVYLPVIMHLARTADPASGWALLALYNTAFILPLVGVFAVAWAGVAVRPVAALFADRLTLVKVLMGLVFLGFAALTLFT